MTSSCSKLWAWFSDDIRVKQYRQTSNISRIISQNLNVSRPILQLSLPNPLKPGVKSIMKMFLEQRRQAMLQLHMSDQQIHCLLMCDLYWRFDGKLLFLVQILISTAVLVKGYPMLGHQL